MHTTQRQSDELYCTRCHKRWGVSEEPPRSCAPSESFVRRGRNPDLAPPHRVRRSTIDGYFGGETFDILERLHKAGRQHLFETANRLR